MTAFILFLQEFFITNVCFRQMYIISYMMKWMMIKKKATFGILLIYVILNAGCRNSVNVEGSIYRFENDLFKFGGAQNPEGFNNLKNQYPDFFPVFCSDIIGIGPDTSQLLPTYLNQFITDPVIISIKETCDSVFPDISELAGQIHSGISRYNRFFLIEDSIQLISYISGFNQSFVSLPGILGIGLDNYLGAETPYYQQLAIPKYIVNTMAPEFLVSDAVRAWIISENPQTSNISSLLDHMVYEGKILFLLHESIPGQDEHIVFRFSKDQLEWCYEYERSMWEFIIENELLYSTDRLLIRRLTKEAPFVKEFGQESPGRAASWLGFRIMSSYLKRTGKTVSDLVQIKDSRTILSESRYRPK